MSIIFRRVAILALLISTFGCGKPERSVLVVDTGRWYTAGQVDEGRALFQVHCAVCHGDQAQGLADDWRKTDAQGNYPPPPLNGSAHAWHHPLVVLETTIKEGGASFGGLMPGFSDSLIESEARSTIAYFQSLWTDEIYMKWAAINDQ